MARTPLNKTINDILDIEVQDGNTYSAFIPVEGTSFTSQNSDIFESVSKGGTGVYNIVFKSGSFTIAPTVVANSQLSTSSSTLGCYIGNVTVNGCTIEVTYTYGDNNYARINTPIHVLVQNQGVDYNAKRTLRDIIGE